MICCRSAIVPCTFNSPLDRAVVRLPQKYKREKGRKEKEREIKKKIKNQTLANVCRYVVTWTVRMPSTPVAYSLPDHISSTRSVRVSKNQIKRGLGLLLLLLLLHRNN